MNETMAQEYPSSERNPQHLTKDGRCTIGPKSPAFGTPSNQAVLLRLFRDFVAPLSVLPTRRHTLPRIPFSAQCFPTYHGVSYNVVSR